MIADFRTNRKTKVAYKPGWQRERMLNLDSYMTNSPKEDQVNMVADGWTELPGYSAVLGTPGHAPLIPTPENLAAHVGKMHKLDMPRTDSVRARTLEIVKDQETAKKLQAWYPTWSVNF